MKENVLNLNKRKMKKSTEIRSIKSIEEKIKLFQIYKKITESRIF